MEKERKLDLLVKHLNTLNKKYNLMTREEVAHNVHVTSQTVINFEKNRSISVKVLLYYISKLTHYLGNDEYIEFITTNYQITKMEIDDDLYNILLIIDEYFMED